MTRSLVIPDVIYPCGTVIGPDGSDKNGEQMASFTCILCGKVRRSRFREIRKGTIKSCKCGRSKRFIEFHTEIVEAMTMEARRQIFADEHATSTLAAAKKHELQKASVDFIRRNVEAWL